MSCLVALILLTNVDGRGADVYGPSVCASDLENDKLSKLFEKGELSSVSGREYEFQREVVRCSGTWNVHKGFLISFCFIL